MKAVVTLEIEIKEDIEKRKIYNASLI